MKGYTTSYDRDNFECMYIQYKALRGNGVMEDVRRSLRVQVYEK